jgi:transcriptional regulator GlxA family with amidase domain
MKPTPIPSPTPEPTEGQLHVAFLLLPEYSMLAFTSALETMRMANYISQRTLYTWSLVTPDNVAVHASNNLAMEPTATTDALASCDLMFVCGGTNVGRAVDNRLRSLLRQCAQRNIPLGALCTGTYALASAGLLDGHRCAIHWENLAAIREEFPKVAFSQEVFIIDRLRMTCSGGVAPLHLFLHLIRAHHGAALAMAISEQFIVDRLRAADDQQQMPQPEVIGPGYQHLTESIELMAANIEEPLLMADVASVVQISLRQLERLFQRYFQMNPAQYYMGLRLRRARELLMLTSQPITQITVACGFQSASHFCKAYRNHFGNAPSEQRRLSCGTASGVRGETSTPQDNRPARFSRRPSSTAAH